MQWKSTHANSSEHTLPQLPQLLGSSPSIVVSQSPPSRSGLQANSGPNSGMTKPTQTKAMGERMQVSSRARTILPAPGPATTIGRPLLTEDHRTGLRNINRPLEAIDHRDRVEHVIAGVPDGDPQRDDLARVDVAARGQPA